MATPFPRSQSQLLWEERDRKVQEQQPSSTQTLRNALQEKWNSVPSQTLQKLIERMPKTCKAVIKNRGGYFDESKI